MSKLHTLAQAGQAIWFDYIRRSLITSGEMQALIDQGVRGVTSNPTIFEKAIAGSSDYDEDIKALVKKGTPIEGIYENLALWDIARTADLFRPVYEETRALDGYVSIEVSPTLAYDAQGTVAEARKLFAALARPNIMIKVPATREGITAIETLIDEGINVNVTLLFSVESYKQAAYAYLSGLEKLLAAGRDISSVASVASFFVSRVDTLLDPELEKKAPELAGKIAVDNAKVAYGFFRDLMAGERWQALAARGAMPQRLLWASTGTKNPAYPDTLYIDELVGPHTVNTVPPATLQAFMDHGSVEDRLGSGLDEAKARIGRLEGLGIDLDAVTAKLQQDGVESFAGSFRSLMDSIRAKRRELIAGTHLLKASLGKLDGPVQARLERLKNDRVVARVWEHDHTLWNESPREITNRLGWLGIIGAMLEKADEIEDFARDVRARGYTKAYLLGMGGSSLAPEVMREILGVADGWLDLVIVDTTDPAFLLDLASGLDPSRSLFIVSSKSGSTVETSSAFAYFHALMEEKLGAGKAGEHFIAVTDPGSSLVALARQRGFLRVFVNDPNIGGRYSALSCFGLVPAALMGADIRSLLDRALVMTENCEASNCVVNGNNHGGRLGAILGEAARGGRDKATFVISPGFTAFGDWVEQLVAESTGKEGTGIVPVVGEHPGFPGQYRDDRIFIHLRLNGDETHDDRLEELEQAGHPVVRIALADTLDLGGQFFLWEMATAVAGHVLGINPFDQPDVEAAKASAREAVEEFRKTGSLPAPAPALSAGGISLVGDVKGESIEDALKAFLGNARPGSYVAIQAFLPPSSGTGAALDTLRMTIRDTCRVATMCGYGPRYLHSTGQLHKGDSGRGLFIQLTCANAQDAVIPGDAGPSLTFGTLKDAQALGDFNALKSRGRPVIRLHIEGGDIPGALKVITEALS
ncbi:MAG TPA: bifunctional transaldolase/phosoglucose isomerase [Deltaproteobacteria bacterium]|jgi:transaldolase/glucose-6-phosphate isomerase|nr:bifunctional transaldolase/phosoglucose isomerase [Deltaproteobacteria bacterium]HOI07133.1 bifunctional transaldolase/phosoglucose isomerase [Deltaproteobacteria bacterium]